MRPRPPFALLLVLMLAVGGCGFSGSGDAAGRKVLRMNNMAEPVHLDPAMQTVVEDQRLSLALFEGLLSYDPETLKPREGVATTFETSPDKRTWTFRLRETTFSNGVPLTADDFVYSWRRVLSPPSDRPTRRWSGSRTAIVADYAPNFFAIVGARDYYEGKTDDWTTVGIAAPDPSTLVVRLIQPTPWFAELLCSPTFAPVERRTVETHGRAWTRPENFVGNGPFMLAERRIGDSLRVVKNPRYWDAARVELDAIVYYSTDQIDTALDQYLAGETDWVRTFNPKKVRAWRADPVLSEALRAPPYLGTYFYRFNVTKRPLDDGRVRRALALAVDRAAICEHLCGLGEEPAVGMIPPCLGAVVPWTPIGASGLAYDPDRARSELAAAGYPGGAGLPTIELAYNSDIRNKAIAEAVQSMWKKELGVQAELMNRDKRVHVAEERALRYQASRGSWIGDFNDPYTFLEFMVSSRPNNRTGWRNAEYDRLVEESVRDADEAERLRKLARAERILMVEDAPIMGLFHFRSVMVLRPRAFDGIFDNTRDLHPPKYIRLRKP